MSRTLNVCIAQINYDSAHIKAHVERIKGIITQNRAADLIVFPELILHGHPSLEKPEGFLYRKMKAVYGPISSDLYRFIQARGARVIFGELKRSGDYYHNLATYVDAHGVQSYSKCHVHWTENFVPGRRLKVFHTPLGRIGINICFDAAFSETWRMLALLGADLMVNIAAVPASFAPRFMRRRMQGAAIFNQRPVIYANRPGAYFGGRSAMFDATGEVTASAGTSEEILHGAVDLEAAEAWREAEPVFPHRRPLLYRDIANRGPGECARPLAELGEARGRALALAG
ncbi:MAG: carbon-nitrogen hydrolase family protein [Pseudomonadota bacterium]